MKTAFKSFFDRFNQNESHKPESEEEIKKFESENQITLPSDYKKFLSEYGDLWTPNILDIIDDNELEIYDVQNFWTIDKIRHDRQNEWTSQLEPDLIPFASDAMGNIFAFRTNELKELNGKSLVYIFDHDFDTVESVASSFTEWIEEFLEIEN